MSVELISGIIESAFNVDFKMMFAVIFRTIIVTLLIVFVIKWLGNKGLGQLSTIELIIILGLGNAVSEPMLNPTETSIPQGSAVIIISPRVCSTGGTREARSRTTNSILHSWNSIFPIRRCASASAACLTRQGKALRAPARHPAGPDAQPSARRARRGDAGGRSLHRSHRNLGNCDWRKPG